MTRVLLSGAQVVSLAPNRPDTECTDVLIEDGHIAAMGGHLDPTGAEVIDLTDRIVIPGLVNAHLHTWQTALRFAGADWSLLEYLAHTHGHVARIYSQGDMHIGTLAGALNQINCGTTTVGDWCHNCLTPGHADAAIDALTTAGIRAVFLHGAGHGGPAKPHDLREIDRLYDGPIANSALLTLGMAIKGPQLSAPDAVIADLRAAIERGLVASMHQSAGPPGPGWNDVSAAGLWGPHANIGSPTPESASPQHRKTNSDKVIVRPSPNSCCASARRRRSVPTQKPRFLEKFSPLPGSPWPAIEAWPTNRNCTAPGSARRPSRSPASRRCPGRPCTVRAPSAWPIGSAISRPVCKPTS